jgi:glycosyltransferase involved in cell wall biosynthesis
VDGWSAVKKKALEGEVDHCLLMELNRYQAVLGLPRARGLPFSISGILFFPYCRIESPDESLPNRFVTSVERLRKRMQLQWVLSNPSVENIFVLNDDWGRDQLNEELNTDAFTSVPDPVPPFSVDEDKADEVSAWAQEHWTGDRTHFLLFGSLRKEKGVLEAIDAFHLFSAEEASDAAFHLLGETRSDLRDLLSDSLCDLKADQPELHVHFEDRFLSETELVYALKRSDAVLAPYLRTEGSSGVLSHSANHGLPVVGSETGLIGQLIQEYELGSTVDVRSPNRLCEAMLMYLRDADEEMSTAGMQTYVDERSPRAFAEKIVSTISTD